jgi:hypothetical protein
VTPAEFRQSLSLGGPPSSLSLALQSLWWMEKGDWTRAHGLIDDADGADECWVHAHLHRVEGDLANAGYWYRRASQPVAASPLGAERAQLIATLLADR